MPDAVGLIAGSGRFPILFAEEARRMGVPVVAVALSGVTDPSLAARVLKLETFKLGQVSAPLKFLKESGVRRAVMAGKVQHASLFGGVLPDLRAVKILATVKDRRTDTILSAIAEEFQREGIELLSSATYLSHLLATEGPMTKRAPSKSEAADIALGWRAAKGLAGLDIGQSVAVADGAIVAVEAMEGTDAMLLRAAELGRAHGASAALVLVKVAKPRQDFRFDLPVVGLETLAVLERAGARVLALEAGKTLMFDKEELLAKADALGLSVVGLKDTPSS